MGRLTLMWDNIAKQQESLRNGGLDTLRAASRSMRNTCAMVYTGSVGCIKCSVRCVGPNLFFFFFWQCPNERHCFIAIFRIWT